MTHEEIKNRLEAGESSLDLSIEKYEKMIIKHGDYLKIDLGPDNCALCHEYFRNTQCKGCPVAGKNPKYVECRCTPYTDMNTARDDKDEEAFWRCALAELDLLKSLLGCGLEEGRLADCGVMKLKMNTGTNLLLKLHKSDIGVYLTAVKKDGSPNFCGNIFYMNKDGTAAICRSVSPHVPIQLDDRGGIVMMDTMWNGHKTRADGGDLQIQGKNGNWISICGINDAGKLRLYNFPTEFVSGIKIDGDTNSC